MPKKGQVKVGTLVEDKEEKDWAVSYSHTGGAARLDRRGTTGKASIVRLFEEFHYLIVEERINPEAVHKAFLEIGEYAEMFGGPSGCNDSNRPKVRSATPSAAYESPLARKPTTSWRRQERPWSITR